MTLTTTPKGQKFDPWLYYKVARSHSGLLRGLFWLTGYYLPSLRPSQFNVLLSDFLGNLNEDLAYSVLLCEDPTHPMPEIRSVFENRIWRVWNSMTIEIEDAFFGGD